MKNYFLFFTFSFQLITLSLFGQKETKPFLVKESTLYFKDSISLVNTFKQLMEYDEVKLDSWEKQIGFTSNRTLVNKANLEFEKIKTEEELKYLLEKHSKLLFYDPIDSTAKAWLDDRDLGTIANKDGIFYVGKAVCQIKGNYLIEVANGDKKELKAALENPNAKTKKGVRISVIKNTAQTLSGSCNPTDNSGERARTTLRAKMSIFITNFVSRRLIFTTYSQQKIAGVWFNYNSAYHNFQIFNIKVNCPPSGDLNFTHNATQFNNITSFSKEWPLPNIGNFSNFKITAINAQLRTSGIYPYWLQMVCP